MTTMFLLPACCLLPFLFFGALYYHDFLAGVSNSCPDPAVPTAARSAVAAEPLRVPRMLRVKDAAVQVMEEASRCARGLKLGKRRKVLF